MSLEKIRRLAARAGTAGEAAAAHAAAERLLARLRADIEFCKANRRMLRHRERRFLDELSKNREPTPREALMIASIAVAIRNDPRHSGR
jgi:hypothetical protein